MLKKTASPIDRIRVPVNRVKPPDPDKVQALAESILAEGQTTPISCREGGEDFVPVEGLHRIEAPGALGKETVAGYLVRARLD